VWGQGDEGAPKADTAITLLAPAKLNLGLAITGRRSDDYHELVTIFQAISIYDRLTLAPADELRLICDDPALAGPDNLALLALLRLRELAEITAGATVHLSKSIPVAAGLGGASSDAAAALLVARRLWRLSVDGPDLAQLAASLGSDVPFFLHGGTALATGRGDRLTPLPTPAEAWFVVVAPAVQIPRKTATLYAALTAGDFGDGATVLAQAERLRAGRGIEPASLPNAFTRALYRLRPELAELPAVMRRHGAPNVALSGAGPSHYTLLRDPAAAERLVANLAGALRSPTRVFVARPVPAPPVPTVPVAM
jgi:4-diphosphocytidyl-2-C-methyl-D-erythritol kinase